MEWLAGPACCVVRKPVRITARLWVEGLERSHPFVFHDQRAWDALGCAIATAAGSDSRAACISLTARSAVVAKPAVVRAAVTTSTSTQLATLTLKPLDPEAAGTGKEDQHDHRHALRIAGQWRASGKSASFHLVTAQFESSQRGTQSRVGFDDQSPNSASLSVSGVGTGSLSNATAAITNVVHLTVAPVHLDLLGVVVDTSPIRVTITTHSGQGLVLGNAVTI